MEDEKCEIKIQNKTQISRLAYASLILAIISPFTAFTFLTPFSIILPFIAIILGFISFFTIRNSEPKIKGKGYAIAGITISILLYSFIFLILLPALGKLKYFGRRITCENNMKVIGKAMLVYVNDSEPFPNLEKWCDILIEECNVPIEEFRCPMAEEGPCNYALNKYVAEMKPINDPDIVVFFETQPGWNQVGGPEILTTEYHEGEGCNIVFLDGHTEFIYTRNLHKLKWKPDE